MVLCSTCGEGLKQGAKFCGGCGTPASLAGEASGSQTLRGQSGTPAAQPAQKAPRPPFAAEGSTYAQAAPSLSDVYTTLGSEGIREAAKVLSRWWGALRWEIRVTVVAAALALTAVLFISASGVDPGTPGGFVFSIVLLPIVLGALVAVARPDPVPGWIARFIAWSAMKRRLATEKGSFPAKWFFRPFYGLLCSSSSITSSIREPYLCAGATLALQFFAVYVALFAVYAAIMVVIAVAVILFVFWFISLMLSEGFSSGSRRYSGRSETRETLFGRKYTQHFDSSGEKAGYTEQRAGLFGNQYQQHFSQDGEKTGRTDARESLFGNKYQQHYDGDGSKAGYSENKEGLLGNRYVQEYDQDGEKTRRSELREHLLGGKYVAHEDEGD